MTYTELAARRRCRWRAKGPGTVNGNARVLATRKRCREAVLLLMVPATGQHLLVPAPRLPHAPPSPEASMCVVDKLWMCLFSRLGDLCLDSRPATRKSAGQTLFSTIAAHGSLLAVSTWQAVLWQVLFPLLNKVGIESGLASTEKTDGGGALLIHHRLVALQLHIFYMN